MFDRSATLHVITAMALSLAAGCGSHDAAQPTAPSSVHEPEAPESGSHAASVANASAVDELPVFDPSTFVSSVAHPLFPLPAGRVTTFQEAVEEGGETIVVEVLTEQKSILGIGATVVRDRVYVGGQLVEDTFDWFAQDGAGNVWYLGEDVTNYEVDGSTNKDGSWEAGQNGATAGIVMLAAPEVGDSYQQELFEGVAEDRARVRRLDETVVVPYGTFAGCLQTLEWTPLEPGAREYKYYAPGLGLVLETSTHGGKDRVELVSVTGP